jgi:hypothetical protein
LCDHRVPAAEDDYEQGRQGKDHRCRHQGVALTLTTWAERGAVRLASCADRRPRCRVGHGPSPDRASMWLGSGGCLTSGDECCTRRLTSNLWVRGRSVVMPSYRLPGLPEDER